MADGFGKSHNISSGSSRTDVVLVFVDIVLPVTASVDIRNIVGTNVNRFLIDLSRLPDIPFIQVVTLIKFLQAIQFIILNLFLSAKIGSTSLGSII